MVMIFIPAIFLDYNMYIIFINLAFVSILAPYCTFKTLTEDDVTIFNVITDHPGRITLHFFGFASIFAFLKLSTNAALY